VSVRREDEADAASSLSQVEARLAALKERAKPRANVALASALDDLGDRLRHVNQQSSLDIILGDAPAARMLRHKQPSPPARVNKSPSRSSPATRHSGPPSASDMYTQSSGRSSGHGSPSPARSY
jgi:hypothetical protein